MATHIRGHFAYCKGEGTFSLGFDCTGPNCEYLNGYPGTNCQNTTDGLRCTSSTACQETNYTSTFDLSQLGMKVRRNETINLLDYGKNIKITSDGSKRNVTVIVEDAKGKCSRPPHHGQGDCDSDRPSKFSSVSVPCATSTHTARDKARSENTIVATPITGATSSAMRVKFPRTSTIFVIWFVICLLFGVVSATLDTLNANHDSLLDVSAAHLDRRTTVDGFPITDLQPVLRRGELESRALPRLTPEQMKELVDALYSHLSAWFAGRLPIPTAPEIVPLQNGLRGLLIEIQSFACSQGLFYLINGVLQRWPWQFIDACSGFVRVAFLDTGPGEIIGMLVAPTLCSYLLNILLDTYAPAVLTETCNSIMDIAKEWFGEEKAQAVFKPYISRDFRFYDLETDPANCGQVGRQVRCIRSL